MASSAASFSLRSNSRASASSSSGVLPRGRVPLMGRVSTRPPAHSQEALGGGADDGEVVAGEVGRHRRGIDAAKPQVQFGGRNRDPRLEPAREVHLEDVARGDVVLAALNRPKVVAAGEIARRSPASRLSPAVETAGGGSAGAPPESRSASSPALRSAEPRPGSPSSAATTQARSAS